MTGKAITLRLDHCITGHPNSPWFKARNAADVTLDQGDEWLSP